MDSLAFVHADIAKCRLCERLVAWREQVAFERRAAYRDEEYWGRGVPGFGDGSARVLVVGLAPAAHGANRTGRMFTGDRSGDWLYRALWRAGFASRPDSTARDDGMVLTGAFITAPVRCAPPQNKPRPEEQANCRQYLDRELALLGDLRVFVALGQIAYDSICGVLGVRPKPKFGHGVEVAVDERRHIVCSYHVSQQNTFTGRLTQDMLDAVFARARALAGLGAAPEPRSAPPASRVERHEG